MRVLLFTSQDISRKLTEFFFKRKDIELTVVTQVTRRDQIYGYASTVEFCKKKNIPCWMPKRLDDEFIQKVRVFNPDIIVAAYFPQIFPSALLEIPRLGAVNVHPGDLPNYRGTFAIPWTILNGEKDVTVTLHYIDSGIDSGDVIVKKRFTIDPEETGFELYGRAMHFAADLLMKSFDPLIKGKLGRQKQKGYGSYFNKLPARYHIDWNQPREEIKRQVRVHALPYVPAYTYLFNHAIFINKVSFCDSDGTSAHGAGFIVKIGSGKRFAVACADGWLLVEEYGVYPPLEAKQAKLHFVTGVRLD